MPRLRALFFIAPDGLNAMRVLFWQPAARNAAHRAVTVRGLNTETGMSGTDTCLLEVARWMARRGHEVNVMAGGPEDLTSDADGVRYLDQARLSTYNFSDLDVFSPMFYVFMPEILPVLPCLPLASPRLHVLLWCQCFLRDDPLGVIARLIASPARVSVVGVSEFVGSHYADGRNPWGLPYVTIENALNPEAFGRPGGAAYEVAAATRDEDSFVFHPVFERGGAVALRVHARVRERGVAVGPVHLASYCVEDAAAHGGVSAAQSKVVTHGSLSKHGLAALLSKSGYFVYPLVLQNGNVHHDTYGCAVLEALACGVLVVTWDVACMRAVYGDLITRVPLPPSCRHGYDPNAQFANNPALLNEDAVDALASAVVSLAALPPAERQARRDAGRAWALAQTYEARAAQLEAFLSPPWVPAKAEPRVPAKAEPQVLLTCFAGRESCMKLLLVHARRLMEAGLVDEFHAWNFTRDPNDEAWLRRVMGGHAESSGSLVTTGPAYRPVPDARLVRGGGSLSLTVQTASDAHMLLSVADAGREDVAEIVLGGWGNTRSVARRVRQGDPVASQGAGLAPHGDTIVRLELDADGLSVTWRGAAAEQRAEQRLVVPGVGDDGKHLALSLSSWGSHQSATWQVRTPPATGGAGDSGSEVPATDPLASRFKLMHVHNKREWVEYYRHYTRERYPHPDTVIIKCDDDIVYIDTDAFAGFLARRRALREPLLAFPNIINNGVCADLQQQLDGLLPAPPAAERFQMLKAGCEPIVYSGGLGQAVHRHFLDTLPEARAKLAALADPVWHLPINHRISINFFAILAADLDTLAMISGKDDEHELTQQLPGRVRRGHYVDRSMLVSHLGFGPQRRTGLDEPGLLAAYAALVR
jgi:glycosyltransferase involved in cell wall biosynthesis